MTNFKLRNKHHEAMLHDIFHGEAIVEKLCVSRYWGMKIGVRRSSEDTNNRLSHYISKTVKKKCTVTNVLSISS